MVVNAQESPFCFKKSQETWSKECFGKFLEKQPNFKEKSYEIVKIFGRFWENSNFFLLKFIFNY
jgi:hypothetical protein